ncbi:MAG: T9SS type A sorting domain-containing protein [Saprospiraceae bacterium]|nr:T9SS type A sorting domain-containing protein [Saprospiraceae bacterium]
MSEIEEVFEVYEKTNKHTEGEVEDRWTTFFHRWRRAYAPFVQENGDIKLPTNQEFQARLEADNAQYVLRTNRPESTAANWTCIGPNETYWLKDHNSSQPACPWQVNIYAFDVYKANTSIMYAATETGAVFKTSDKGQNWTVCANGFNFGGSSEAIAIHPSDHNTVFLGVNSNIYKTTDGGDTWTSIYNFTGLGAYTIAISASDPSLILIAAEKGLFRSTDGGSTWTRIYTTACYDVKINPLSNNHVFLLKMNGSYVEFLKSTDSGATFSTKAMSISNATSGRLAVTAADDSRIYGLFTTDSGARLLKSSDEGETWTTCTVSFCTGGISDATNGQGFYDLSVAASPTDANNILFGLCSIHKSTDGGTTSSYLGGYCGSFPLHPDLQQTIITDTEAWVATDGGLTISTDFFTSQSESRNNGIFATDFWGFGQGWNEDIMVGGRYHNGNTAMADFYPSGKALRMGGAEAGTGYVLHGRTRAVSFSDLGGGWTLPETFYDNAGAGFSFTKYPNEDGYGYNSSPVIIDPRYAKHIYLGEGTTLWKTIDGGATFNALYNFGVTVRRYDISRSNPSVLYLTTTTNFYKSTDGGVSWTAKTLPVSRNAGNMRFSLSPTDENVIWAAFDNIGGTLLGKVYRSTDGGTSWTDMTTNALDNLNIKWVQFTGNTEGGVYIAAVNSKGRVFYRDNSKSTWEDFSTNLPASMDIIRMLPFYRDGKLRVAGNRGVWETTLYNTNFAPIAQPMSDKQTSRCVRDTFYFDDYSITKHVGTSWSWSFSPTPQYISDANSRNPKVVFGSQGNYSVTLTVTNGDGTSTKTISNMVSIVADECSPEVVAGKAMSSTANGDHFLTPSVDLGSTNTITIMAWVRPTGTQSSYAAILSCNGVNVNLNLRDNNELGLHWNDSQWWWSTGLVVPADKWSHVALVATATDMTLYLNGKAAVNTADPVAMDLSNRSWYIGCDRGRSDRTFKGKIDEVAFFNRSLTQNEIREQMHLTKSVSDASLKGYFQFNETSGDVYNRVVVGSAAFVGSATRVTSTAPVGGGVSERQTVTTSGVKNFSTAGLSLTFPSGTLPNGELCVTRISNAPDELPNANQSSAKYWIISNYGSNATFANLTNMTFTGYGAVSAGEASTPSGFKLYKRESGQDAATWGNSVGSAGSATSGTEGVIGFNAPAVTSFSQFIIMRETVLPLTLSAFDVQKVGKKQAKLDWSTEYEENIAYFDIEKSKDGRYFEKIGTVKAVGQSTEKRSYFFNDNEEMAGQVYYRLKMVDNDAHSNYSKIQSLNFDRTVAVFIYPNPVGNGKLLIVNTNLEEKFDVTLTSISGKTVFSSSSETPEMRLNTEGLPKGLYILELKSKTHWRFEKVVIE